MSGRGAQQRRGRLALMTLWGVCPPPTHTPYAVQSPRGGHACCAAMRAVGGGGGGGSPAHVGRADAVRPNTPLTLPCDVAVAPRGEGYCAINVSMTLVAMRLALTRVVPPPSPRRCLRRHRRAADAEHRHA